jgi:osmotically inducible lipoprotein OsmB
MKLRFPVLILAASLALLGCSGMTTTQQSTLSGSAIGAAAGAGIAAIAGGNPATGALVGAAGGALTGYLVGEKKSKSQ